MSLSAQVHYGGTACLDAIEADLGTESIQESCLFNATKYWWRIDGKGRPVEDAEKAAIYLEWWDDRCRVDPDGLRHVSIRHLQSLSRVGQLISGSSETARNSDGAKRCLAIINNTRVRTP